MKWKESYLWFFLVLGLCALVLWPLARAGFFVSDDGEWMVIRLSAFFQSFREGQFPVRFLGRLNHEFGYPVANFLYPGFMYVGSLIHALGASFVDTIKIIFVGSIIGAAWFIFLWLRRWFSTLSSFIGTAAFVFSPYLLFDLYERGSVGEVLAFLPAAIGLYSIEKDKRTLLSFAVAGLVVSHNTLAMLFLGVFLLRIFWRRAVDLLLPVTLGLGMSGFFWLPALYERKFVAFDEVLVSNPSAYFVGTERTMLLGIVFVISWILLLFRSGATRAGDRWFFIILFAGGVFLATPLSTPIWNWESLTRLVQFPYRFLAVSVISGAWLVAHTLEHIKNVRWALLLLFIPLWMIPLWSTWLGIERIQKAEGFYTTNEGTTTVADEYMPRWVRIKAETRPVTKYEFVSGQGSIIPKSLSTQRLDAEIDAEDLSTVQINTLYYPGWGVTIDGIRVPINFHNPRGVMQIVVPAGSHRLVAEFRETPARFAADLVSVVSGIFVILFAVSRKKRYTERKR